MNDPLRFVLDVYYPARTGPAAAGDGTWGAVSCPTPGSPGRAVAYGADVNNPRDFIAFLVDNDDDNWSVLVEEGLPGRSCSAIPVEIVIPNGAVGIGHPSVAARAIVAVRVLVAAAASYPGGPRP